jgi:hypothetical protein
MQALFKETIMKLIKLASVIAAAVLSLSAVAAPGARFDVYGSAAPVSAAQRSVTITPGTRFINVNGGETVRFNVNGQSFAWDFTVGQNVSAIDMRRIAPPGLIDRKLVIYVTPDLRYYP